MFYGAPPLMAFKHLLDHRCNFACPSLRDLLPFPVASLALAIFDKLRLDNPFVVFLNFLVTNARERHALKLSQYIGQSHRGWSP